ncbi:MAG: alpha/beta fold hydrolase [Planctomycetaceae bacterium]|nr:alpha/beta fold hydrolase [Planctomycetaceae bacterium]
MKKKDVPSWRSLYPFNSHYFDLDGLRLHYLDEMKPKNAEGREVMLFVHGNPTWSFYFRRLITEFRNSHRAVAVDHIGCGLSDKPNEKQYPFTLERRIDDLCRLIEHLNLQNITLVGHDWGGAIGMGAAVRQPERFKRFVLMNTASFANMRCPLRITVCRLPVFGRIAVQCLNLFSLGTVWMAIASRKNLSAEAHSGLLAPYDSWANRTAVYRFVRDIPISPTHPSYAALKNIEDALPSFSGRNVCLIWGMQDWCFSPDFLKRYLQFFPDADVHRLDNAHHLVVEDAPDEVIAAIKKFLRTSAI